MFVSIGNACTWHWVWQVRLSELQTLSPVIHPTQACTLVLSTAPVCFSAQSLWGFPSSHTPALPTRIRNRFFWEIKSLALQTASDEYSRASQTGLVLHASVPSHLSSSPSLPPNLTLEVLWVPSSWTRLCSFQLTAVLCAHTDLLLA